MNGSSEPCISASSRTCTARRRSDTPLMLPVLYGTTTTATLHLLPVVSMKSSGNLLRPASTCFGGCVLSPPYAPFNLHLPMTSPSSLRLYGSMDGFSGHLRFASNAEAFLYASKHKLCSSLAVSSDMTNDISYAAPSSNGSHFTDLFSPLSKR